MQLETLDDLKELIDLVTFIRDRSDRHHHHKKKKHHTKKPKKSKKRSSSSSSNSSSGSSGDKGADSQSGFKPFQLDALKKHNELRALHKDTPPMTLDKRLCKGAQAWADHLVKRHTKLNVSNPHSDPGSRKNKKAMGGYYGENIDIKKSGSTPTPEHEAVTATQCWYDEIKNYDWHHPGKHRPGKDIGHFTQVVWDNSVKMGIGFAHDPKTHCTWVVARYQKPGNYSHQYGEHVHPLK